MNIDINGTLLQWELQERMMADLAMDHVDRGRCASTLATGRQILADLGAVLGEVKIHPHSNPADDQALILAAQEKARDKLKPLTATLAKLQSEAVASAELPVKVTTGVDPAVVAAIRGRLAQMDPLMVHAEYVSAAQRGDAATLVACNDAHPVAVPSVAQMFAANPGVRTDAATTVRVNNDPGVAKMIEDKVALTDSLGAIISDLSAACGAPDEIARMAQGA